MKKNSLEASYLILNTSGNSALRQKFVFVLKQTNIDKNCQTAVGSVTEHRHSQKLVARRCDIKVTFLEGKYNQKRLRWPWDQNLSTTVL